MGIFNWFKPVEGLVNSVGNQVQKNRRTFKGDEENAQQRGHDNTISARDFKPQGWLGKQIRPVATLIVLSPLLAITVIITILTIKILLPLIESLDDLEESIISLQAIFSLYDVLSPQWWEICKLVLSFWFGGRIIQHAMASNTVHQHIKNGGKLVGKVARKATAKGKKRNNSALAEFQSKRNKDWQH